MDNFSASVAADQASGFWPLGNRFRGYLPVVVDVETGGFNARTDALLEIAATTLKMDEQGYLHCAETHFYRVVPFSGSNLEPAALAFNKIDPYHPFRLAKPEDEVLTDMFRHVRQAVRANRCTKAILVGHNASFDHGFLNAAVARCRIKRNPFHPFSSFDTATLAGLAFGQTVLARACRCAGLDFENSQAHSARYDTIKTAELFCSIVNHWKRLGGNIPSEEAENDAEEMNDEASE